nr:transposase [Weizmannia acidilactici]
MWIIVGNLLDQTNLASKLNAYKLPRISRNRSCSNGDVAKSYIGLLCQGKSDFDHIETFRDDAFFQLALDIQRVPSSPTLRQRLDQAALTKKWKEILHEESLNLIRRTNAEISPVYTKDKAYIPVDLDVSPFDNSKTKKEGVERTYKGCDGYAPMFAYIGQEGLREQDAPLKKRATRRRIRTVIQNMIIMASKLVTRGANGN